MFRLMSMNKLALVLAIVAATGLGCARAHAQGTNGRTFVSSTGTNNSQCSFTAPCLTFAQALLQTASGGEINCLTPGGFGTVTISISVTINCEGTSNGGILATGNATAITINTAGIVVTLIGLDINGQGSGNAGVYVPAAAFVTIRNCKIYGFTGNGGILYSPNAPSNPQTWLFVDSVLASNNIAGITEVTTGGFATMSVRNSTMSNNTSNGIAVLGQGGTHTGATVEQTTLAFNATGLDVMGTGAQVLMGGSTVVNNVTGVTSQSGGAIYSFQNNQIGGNNNDISGTINTAYPGGLH